jgi:hypothetical protein
MSDQLASWIGDIIGAAGLILPIVQFFRKKPTRRHTRVRRLRYWKIGRIERTRLDEIDDRQR